MVFEFCMQKLNVLFNREGTKFATMQHISSFTTKFTGKSYMTNIKFTDVNWFSLCMKQFSITLSRQLLHPLLERITNEWCTKERNKKGLFVIVHVKQLTQKSLILSGF